MKISGFHHILIFFLFRKNRKKLLEELQNQQRLEGINEELLQKDDGKMDEENLYEENKHNITKKINTTSYISNQYKTPTKDKNFDYGVNFNKGKTESTLNICKIIIF